MVSQRVLQSAGVLALFALMAGGLTGCPVLFGGQEAGSVSFTALPPSGPAPLTVFFVGTANVVPPYEPQTWTWTYGDGAAGDGRLSAHTYTAAGTYTVKLQVALVAPKFRGDQDHPPVTLEATRTVVVRAVDDNNPPIADAGPDQNLFLGPVVTLDGSGSSDPDGDPLTYAWSFVSRPAGSAAALAGANTVNPTFTPDRKGTYEVRLVVNDGTEDSAPDSMIVTVGNRPPVANAGMDQTGFLGTDVVLDGSASSDPDGDALVYWWSFVSVPAGSSPTLGGANTVSPQLTPDVKGTYVMTLTVNDGDLNSTPDTVTVVIENRPPVANAGPDQGGNLRIAVILDGSASSDPDGDPLAYAWTFVSVPEGSSAVLANGDTVNPTFTPDREGSFVAQLIVNDGDVDSAPDTVVITVGNRQPVADAGPNQATVPGVPVTLDGSGSYDPDDDMLTYQWSVVMPTAKSSPILTDADTVNPTFLANAPGVFTVQLVVNDGSLDSAPDTVTVTVGNRPPVADAGTDQSLFLGTGAILDGSASNDPDGDPLTYAWSFVSVPAGFDGTLAGETTVNPTFMPDRKGDYVIQLIVNDGTDDSAPDTVVITVENRPPVADPGTNQSVFIGTEVTLDGSASSDPDGDMLTYAWSFASVPAGSASVLTNETAVSPTFTPDRKGDYVIQLIVNDGTDDSAPDTVTVTVGNRPPVANAGTDGSADPQQVVMLSGEASSDPDGDPLTYAWSFVDVPVESGAALTGADTASPTFVPDLEGTYVIQLIVNDGTVDSAPDTVSIVVTVQNQGPTAVGVVLPDFQPEANVNAEETPTLTANTETLYGIALWAGAWSPPEKQLGPTYHLLSIDPEDADIFAGIAMTAIVDVGDYLYPVIIEGGRGLAVDPTTGEMWAILRLGSTNQFKQQEGPWYALVRVNPYNGVAVAVGNPFVNPLPWLYADLAVADGSQIYGVTDNYLETAQKTVDTIHALYGISSVDTSDTFVIQFPEPNDIYLSPGEVIAFNPDDGLMYHASGSINGLTYRLFESLNLDTLNLIPSTTGSSFETWYEPTAMTYIPGTGQFILADNTDGMNALYRLTPSGSTVPDELIGYTGRGDAIEGLAFLYDRTFSAPEVTVSAAGSSDPNGDPLTYAWSFVSVPDGSALTDADLSDPTGVETSFTPDVLGAYELQVIVNDGTMDSAPAMVTVNYVNSAPVADAGDDQVVPAGQFLVQLSGADSYDPDGDTLTYEWTFLSTPPMSIVDDSWIDTSSPAPYFYFDYQDDDVPYVLQLTVTDADGATSTDTVEITLTEWD